MSHAGLFHPSGQPQCAPLGLFAHRLNEPASPSIAGNPALGYLTPPRSVHLHRGPGYANSTVGSPMTSSTPDPLIYHGQTHGAVPNLLPDAHPSTRATAPSLSTSFAQNEPWGPVSYSPLAPNVVTSEPPFIKSSPHSHPDHITHHSLMAATPRTSSRHSRYAHTDRHDNTITAPQPISASSRTLNSTGHAHLQPSGALGLDLRPPRLFTDHLDEWPSTPSQETGPSSPHEAQQSRTSERLRRLAPPSILVPFPPSRFSWTPSPYNQPTYEETAQPEKSTRPLVQAPPRPSTANGRTASQCSPWASPDAGAEPESASATTSALLQRVPFEGRVRRAAGIYAPHDLDTSPTLPPLYPPPVRLRYASLPPVSAPAPTHTRDPVAGPSSRPEPFSSDMQSGEDVDANVDGLSPLDLSFQREPDVDWESSVARCSEAVEDMGYVLRSCALIPLTEVNSLITSLCTGMNTIQATMRHAPTNVLSLEEGSGKEYSQKYFLTTSSLIRTLDLLYLQAFNFRERPSRITKIESVLQKLWRFSQKLSDLGRKLQTLHDHFEVLDLHSRLQSLHTTAAVELEAERVRRRAFDERRAKSRALRHEVRNEMRQAKEAAQARRSKQDLSKMQRQESVGDQLKDAA